MPPIALPPHPRILVIALRRLGDVLLTTALIRSVRNAHRYAKIDVLVFSDTAAILDGNPDIDDVITIAPGASKLDSLATAGRLWRRYDLAISTQAGDRPTFLAVIAGRRRAGLIEDRLIGKVKRFMLHRHAPARGDRHRVDELLVLADVLGIAPTHQVIPPQPTARPGLLPDGPYAVIHAAPMFNYKRWHREGWRAVADHLASRRIVVVATGGPADDERIYLDEIFAGRPDIVRLDGKLSWPELSAVLAGAQVFVGPDTSVTHLAAACGCPVVALYGPTDPRLWGPWPNDGLDPAWEASRPLQMRGTVRLLQHPMPCQPCQQEGCLRHLRSYSLCLDQLPPQHVIAALDSILGVPKGLSN